MVTSYTILLIKSAEVSFKSFLISNKNEGFTYTVLRSDVLYTRSSELL